MRTAGMPSGAFLAPPYPTAPPCDLQEMAFQSRKSQRPLPLLENTSRSFFTLSASVKTGPLEPHATRGS
jgi:hypothetical protein